MTEDMNFVDLLLKICLYSFWWLYGFQLHIVIFKQDAGWGSGGTVTGVGH